MLAASVLAVEVANRWLLAFSVAALVVLLAAAVMRREARLTRLGERGTHAQPKRRTYRRRAGALLALGPVMGLVVDQSKRAELLTLLATLVAAGTAVLAGASFGPTGVDALDQTLAFVLIVVVIRATDGMGNID